ncbi:ribonuclease Y [Candidatus Berkelbacteria bacterium RIFOXYA2_FULL_43_10]|uniref:Ribonuclease Y n=1 Tax=Candidatus Berkelbacteria bacterium RIFOXYA2_FULL_43_10 TaxID=1797472 RepID=A0A1F5EDF7_9BACT|nr:MAG: ribonuclease Y [Candidatus Berkelbacteria bacterium RIFOXYA2_FULL_43_10]
MIVTILIAIAALICGGVLGFIAWQITVGKRMASAKGKAEKIVEDAKVEEKEILLKAKDEAFKFKTDAEAEVRSKSVNLDDAQRELRKREMSLESRFDNLERSRKEVETSKEEITNIKSSLQQLRQKQEESLAKIAKMTKDEAKDILLKVVEKEGKEELIKKMKEVDLYVKDNVDEKAREIIVTAMQRISAETAAETTVSTVPLPTDEMKGRIIGREGRNIQAFEKVTGVDLVIDDTPEAVVISSFDPIRRQVAKVTLGMLVADGRIHPTRIEEAYEKAKKIVADDIKKSGEEAVVEVGVTGLPPEVIRILGRLKFRTSYGQNQLQHAIEVARLSAVLAEEIGADATLSKKAGLLHDLGKAVDHEVPGSHAVISADIMRKYKLPENVIHAVEAHHEDVEIKTAEAAIVQIADAISSARPGARRESLQSYIKRLEELEKVANAFEGVEKAFAIQAGREVRVIVRPEDIDDLSAEKLSKEIARKIEEEVQYPGQVKVQVIREVRAVEYAK